MTDNGATTTYCYDAADRLTSTTDPSFGAVGYDGHGNTTTLGNQALAYDAADRHVVSAEGSGPRVLYRRDATDRIVARTVAARIQLRAVATAATPGVAASLSVPVPAGTVAGDVLVAQVAVGGGTANNVATPAGWTLVDSVAVGAEVRSHVYYRVAGAGEPASYSFGFTVPGEAAAGMAAYSGVDPARPVAAQSRWASYLSSAPVGLSISPDVPYARLLTLFAFQPATPESPPAGMTERWDVSSTGPVAQARTSIEMSDQDLTAEGPTGDRVGGTIYFAGAVSHMVALSPAPLAGSARYGFAGPGDSPAFVLDLAGNVIERTVGLLGGVVLTKRAKPSLLSSLHLDDTMTGSTDLASRNRR